MPAYVVTTGPHVGAADRRRLRAVPARRFAGTATASCFGCGQAEVRHVADEVLFARAAADARVVAALLADRARRCGRRSRARDRRRSSSASVKSCSRIERKSRCASPCWKSVRPAPRTSSASPVNTIRVIGGDERQASRGVAGRRADLERLRSEADDVAVAERAIDVRRRRRRARADLAAERRLHQPGAGDVIGVAVRVERVAQHEPELADAARRRARAARTPGR